MDIKSIIHTHQDKIYKTCLGYLGNQEEAKDLAQEVCVNIWLGMDKIKNENYVSTWIYRVAVNTCLMHKRKKKIKTVSLSNAELIGRIENTTEFQNEDVTLLHRHISELPEQEKIIIILYLEELDYKTIAQITGLSANHIGVKINRIKKLLTQKFKAHGRISNNVERNRTH